MWTIQPNLPNKIKGRLLNSFLSLNYQDQKDRLILDALRAQLYLPAGEGAFNEMADIAREQQQDQLKGGQHE